MTVPTAPLQVLIRSAIAGISQVSCSDWDGAAYRCQHQPLAAHTYTVEPGVSPAAVDWRVQKCSRRISSAAGSSAVQSCQQRSRHLFFCRCGKYHTTAAGITMSEQCSSSRSSRTARLVWQHLFFWRCGKYHITAAGITMSAHCNSSCSSRTAGFVWQHLFFCRCRKYHTTAAGITMSEQCSSRSSSRTVGLV